MQTGMIHEEIRDYNNLLEEILEAPQNSKGLSMLEIVGLVKLYIKCSWILQPFISFNYNPLYSMPSTPCPSLIPKRG